MKIDAGKMVTVNHKGYEIELQCLSEKVKVDLYYVVNNQKTFKTCFDVDMTLDLNTIAEMLIAGCKELY